MNSKNFMQKICIIVGILLLYSSFAGAAPTIVSDIYNGSHTFQLGAISSTFSPAAKSCYTKANYESGSCDYFYACYAVLPTGATSFDHAFLRECADVTESMSTTKSMSFVFSPPKGYRLAVTWFVARLRYTYNFSTQVWATPVTTIVNKEAAEIISLCPDGKMLRNTTCYDAQSFCVNSLGTNMCDNPYQLYMLDYGQGFELTNYTHMCADRENDKICDSTVSLYCSDINLNGICDETEVQISTNACLDGNVTRPGNWICDSVEGTGGTFCRVYYEPVCSVDNNVTYPNECFAQASGKTNYFAGECLPREIEIQCRADTDCFVPCSGVATSCNNYQCGYMGECNPSILQCSVNADCPNSPCVGVSAQCNISAHTCNYIGKCVEKPNQPTSIWTYLASVFLVLWNYIKSLFGW